MSLKVQCAEIDLKRAQDSVEYAEIQLKKARAKYEQLEAKYEQLEERLKQEFQKSNPEATMLELRKLLRKELEDEQKDVKSADKAVKNWHLTRKYATETLTLLLERDSLPSTNKRRGFDNDVYLIEDLTTKMQSFIRTSDLVDGCIQSETKFPYPFEEIEKLFVRTCYKDVFDELLVGITSGKKSFAISGTSGIGKSLFFVYILYRLVKDGDAKSLPLKPKRVMYHAGASCILFDLEVSRVYQFKSTTSKLAFDLLQDSETFYIIDGDDSRRLYGTCIALFISSPRSETYSRFVEKKLPTQWFFPVWTLDELQICHHRVYPALPPDLLADNYIIYGGVARFCFSSRSDNFIYREIALDDVDFVKVVGNNFGPTSVFHTSRSVLKVVVSENYRFRYVDLASKYVGEQMWIRHHGQMIDKLQEMFGRSPSELSRHLFKIYGHGVFEAGKVKLRCRDLEGESKTPFDLELNSIAGSRISFGTGSIPEKPIEDCYYERDGDDNFHAIDSFSRQGMFQFTDTGEHPVRGIEILQQVCKLFDEPKLYFVVPEHRFKEFKKQKFVNETGLDEVQAISGLKQYVLELPMGSLVKV